MFGEARYAQWGGFYQSCPCGGKSKLAHITSMGTECVNLHLRNVSSEAPLTTGNACLISRVTLTRVRNRMTSLQTCSFTRFRLTTLGYQPGRVWRGDRTIREREAPRVALVYRETCRRSVDTSVIKTLGISRLFKFGKTLQPTAAANGVST